MFTQWVDQSGKPDYSGYCPGFNLYTVTDHETGISVTVAADNPDNARFSASIRTTISGATEVVALGPNPAARNWKIARDC